MSRKSVSLSFILRSSLIACIFFISSSGIANAIEENGDPCADAALMELNGSLRGYDDRGHEPLLVKLEIPSPGILSLDVSVPGSARALPKLGLADAACGASATEPVVLERSAAHLVLAAQRPGPHVFQVASQDPAMPLHDFKLISGFSPDAAERLVDKGGEDEEIIEIEPDPLIYVDPAENRSLPSRLHDLCRRGETDDHGDTFTCATFLIPGRDVVGEIRNGWGDDGDVFRILLGAAGEAKLWTLELETTGPTDTFGGLYDQFGSRLEKSDEAGDGGNFRIVRVLPAGTYYVRVEGRNGAEGFYALSVHAAPW